MSNIFTPGSQQLVYRVNKKNTIEVCIYFHFGGGGEVYILQVKTKYSPQSR